MRERTHEGFTIVEVIVVIIIIGVLSGLITVISNNTRARTRDKERIADLQAIRAALELYHAANGRKYPNTNSDWLALYNCEGRQNDNWIPGLAPVYISQLPRDPRGSNDCKQQYSYISDGRQYKLIAFPENCAYFRSNYKALIDPRRPCGFENEEGAVGFWTGGYAAEW